MNILITYAVDPEFAPWRRLQRFQQIPASGFAIQRTSIGAANADFLVTGMGPEYAMRAMESVQQASYDVCICAGFAGALRPEHHVGDVLIPERIEAVGKSGSVLCDPVLVESATLGRQIETLLSSPTIMATASEKALYASAGDAVDMESFMIVSAAQRRRIPAFAVRVISDTCDQDMPVDFSKALDDKGQVSVGGILRTLAGQPGKIAALMKLGRQSKMAAEALAQFLLAYIHQIPDAGRVDVAAQAAGRDGWPSARGGRRN